MGKGLTYWEVLKLLFYYGVSVVNLVLPLTILLSSIMTYGDLGEKYELAAMKAAGISLTRAMMPLFLVSMLLSVLLYFFSNNVIPDFQRKAKNMLYNIAITKPALNFTPGQFIDQIPQYLIKFDEISGEKDDIIKGIFIHKKANAYEDQQSIVAKNGKLVPTNNDNYLKLVLFDGYIFDENIANKDFNQRIKQSDQAIKFDTLSVLFDISELIKQAIDEQKITEDYRFNTFFELNGTIKTLKAQNNSTFDNINNDLLSQTNAYVGYIKNTPKTTKKLESQLKLDSLDKDKKLEILYTAYNKLENTKSAAESREIELDPITKFYSKVVMYQQRIVAYSVTCMIFFLIGASLGSIIRKGGIGLPVVIAIIIFIIFYVLNLSIENIAWSGNMNPYLAAWLPNMILLPFGIWMTYKALTDSQLFDVEKYKTLFKPIINKFSKNKEHQRYK
jgi:lipopolysaccharide export system permease protein